MAKLSLEEKKLKALKAQLFGKSHPPKTTLKIAPAKSAGSIKVAPSSSFSISPQSATTETSYIRSDLFKILILLTLALIFQFSLYFAQIHKLVNLSF